jgi:hypothetical protein
MVLTPLLYHANNSANTLVEQGKLIIENTFYSKQLQKYIALIPVKKRGS